MKHYTTIAILSLLVFIFSSCKKHDDPIENGGISRCVLFYIVSENSLRGADNEDVREILSVKSTLDKDDEIVIYDDNNRNPAIYTINKKTEGDMLSNLTPEYQYSEEHNSCTEASLTDFLNYVKINHPADSYAIVFWSHGSGWIPSQSSLDDQRYARRRSFGIDNGQNSDSNDGNQMSISAMYNALKSMNVVFDFIFFDACFMQTIEVDYELRNLAKYIIGSPAEIPGTGANYSNGFTAAMFSETNYAQKMVELYYKAYVNNKDYGALVSVVDCSQLDKLAASTARLVSVYHDELLSLSHDVQNYFDYNQYRWKAKLPDFYDMNAIFKSILPSDEYDIWKGIFDLAVPFAYDTDFWVSAFPLDTKFLYSDHDQYGGVSMYIPFEKYTTDLYFAEDNKFFVEGFWESRWADDVW